jgi:hypothetical protein
MFTKSSEASGTVALGNVSTSVAGRMVIQVVGASWVGTLTPKARVTGSDADLVDVPATKRSDGATVTSIDEDGIYEVDATGVDVVLAHDHTSGSVAIYAQPVVV